MKKTIILLIASFIMFSMLACNNSSGKLPEQEDNIYEMSKDYNANITASQAVLKDCELVDNNNTISGKVISAMSSVKSVATFYVDVPVDANYALIVRYCCDKNTKYSAFINDTVKVNLGFNGDNSFKITTKTVYLVKGKNTIKIRNTQGQGYEALIDYVKVKGFKTVSDVADILENIEITEGDEKVRIPSFDGFDIDIKSSEKPAIIDVNGKINYASYTESSPITVKIVLEIAHDKNEALKEVSVLVPVNYPSLDKLCKDIEQVENGKIIENNITTLPDLFDYYRHDVLIIESSRQDVINGNGTVSAKKDDTIVFVKYRIVKPNGDYKDTNKIKYIVKGLGYEPASTFINPLGEGEDPYINLIDGWYYHIQAQHSGVNARLEIIRSKSFLEFNETGFKTIYSFEPYSTKKWNCSQVWGPFPLMKWTDGNYYIYYSASDGDNNNHRQGVLKSKTSDPMGEYEDLGLINTSDNENGVPSVSNTVWAIGATTFFYKNEYFLVWSGWKNNYDQFPQRTYIAKIKTPNNISARKEISSPTLDWEGIKEGTPLMEGQTIYNINDKVFLLYSANSSWAGRYRLGLLEFTGTTGDDLLNKSKWIKKENPLFESNENVESPGGPTLVPNQDGSQYWLLYHSSMFNGSGWTRCVSAKPIAFGTDKLPILGQPLPFYTSLAAPKGDNYSQNMIDIIQAEDALNVGDVNVVYCKNSVNGACVGNMKEKSQLQFVFENKQPGFYKIIIRYAAQSEGVKHLLKVNNIIKPMPSYDYLGYNNFFTIEIGSVLKEGRNEITLEYFEGLDAKIDFLGVSYAGE